MTETVERPQADPSNFYDLNLPEPEPVEIDFGDRLDPATGVMGAIGLSAVIWLLWAGLIVGAYGLWAWLS